MYKGNAILPDIGQCAGMSGPWQVFGPSVRSNSPMLPRDACDVPAVLSRLADGGGCASPYEPACVESSEVGRAEIHLWFVPLDALGGGLTRVNEMLDPCERARAAAYRFEEHRWRHVASHAALRRILSAYLGLPPGNIQYTYEACGRPKLAAGINPGKLDFSLSHCTRLALVAVTCDGRVGVDVEELKMLPLALELAKQTLSAEEWSEWCRYPAEARESAFLRLWTRKEACLKADGRGLRRDPRTVPVGSGSEGRLGWSHVMPQGRGQPRWVVCTLGTMEDYIASIALED